MNFEIFKFLKDNFSQKPIAVDRLIVSSFIHKNKLQIRRNKFLKDYVITNKNSEEYRKLEVFLSYFEKHNFKFDFETLIELFEFVVSPADRVINGAVYTPKHIREFIVQESFAQLNEINSFTKICDPACGCGGFLYSAAKRVKKRANRSFADIFKENLYGLDIKDYSITRSKLLLCLLAINEGEDAKEFRFNLFEGDALDFDWSKKIDLFSGFDIIIGNPPYVCSRNIGENTKKHLSKWEVCSSGHPDLYIPFFQLGLENLKAAGVLGYITMNSFFKTINGRALREYFQKSQYDFKIIDFGGSQVFETKSTYTCICLILKVKSDTVRYVKLLDSKMLSERGYSFNILKYSSLNSSSGWNLQNSELLKQIESIGTPFGERYKTRNGIATLKNEVYIFSPVREDKEYYYLQNGSTYRIEKGVCKDIVNPNKLSKTSNFNQLKQKIIFPYYFEGIIVKSIRESRFRVEFPQAYTYLQEKRKILSERDKGNGDYENWYAYGRTQSLEKMRTKLFVPHITQSIPNYIINTDENLLFYNGMAVVCDRKKELQILRKLMSSRLFWFYIINSSKPYGSGFYSLSKNYIKNFGVYNFSEEDAEYIINEKNDVRINSFFESKYGLNKQQLLVKL